MGRTQPGVVAAGVATLFCWRGRACLTTAPGSPEHRPRLDRVGPADAAVGAPGDSRGVAAHSMVYSAVISMGPKAIHLRRPDAHAGQ
jgi:hypothetical protein